MSFIAPAPTETITVNAKALHCLLRALQGPSHHVRELQLLANSRITALGSLLDAGDDDPIGNLVKSMTKWHEDKRAGDVVAEPPKEEPKAKVAKLFDDCRIEQEAFEKQAAAQKLDMTQHPLHYLFLSSATADARRWWNAGRDHAVRRVDEALGGMPDEPQKLIAKGWVPKAFGKVENFNGMINIYTLPEARTLPEGIHGLYLHPQSEVQLIAKPAA